MYQFVTNESVGEANFPDLTKGRIVLVAYFPDQYMSSADDFTRVCNELGVPFEMCDGLIVDFPDVDSACEFMRREEWNVNMQVRNDGKLVDWVVF